MQPHFYDAIIHQNHAYTHLFYYALSLSIRFYNKVHVVDVRNGEQSGRRNCFDRSNFPIAGDIELGMPGARETINNGKGRFTSMFGISVDWISMKQRVETAVTFGKQWGAWGYGVGRFVGWWVVSTALITALPLVFEANRELVVEEMERLQAASMIEQGASPAELQQMGFTTVVDPKVVNA